MEDAPEVVGDVEQWRNMWGARVKWPVEMPDDILRHAIGAWKLSLPTACAYVSVLWRASVSCTGLGDVRCQPQSAVTVTLL
jgi:hypothetical protein